jgi:hypothetical protein
MLDKQQILKLKTFLIIIPITIIFFSLFTMQFTVEFKNNPGNLFGIYGFPIPFSYIYNNNTNGLLEHEIILSYFIIDFFVYFVFFILVSIILKRIFSKKVFNLKKTMIFFIILLYSITIIILILQIYANIKFNYKIINNDKDVTFHFYNFFIGFYW